MKNGWMKHRVTMREVAAVAGVSLATVSRVLSRHPHLDPATRQKVEAALSQTGYRPDPALRAIAGLRWQGRRSKSGEVLAWLDFEPPDHAQGPPESASAAADREGYLLEHVRVSEIGNLSRLGSMLYHRGISGIIVTNTAHTPTLGEFPWERFCAVSCWVGYAANPLDCARFNPFDTVRLGLEKLRDAGCRRPALILVHDQGGLTVTNAKMLSAYQHYAELMFSGKPIAPLIALVDRIRPDDLQPWLHRHQPDGIIGHHDGIHFQLQQAGLHFPRDAAYLSMVSAQNSMEIAHFANLKERCAEVAVEQLTLRLRHNQRGIPAHPMNFVLDPVWVPGKSCPEKSTKASSSGKP
jgi:LacI family transcriptional regulator